jgi:DNA-directed RNA polymerase specialized sigma24 family protein
VFDHEHNRHVMAELMRLAQPKVSETTWEVFRLTVIEGQSPREAAPQLGLSPNAVCAARARVLHQIRLEGRGLLE